MPGPLLVLLVGGALAAGAAAWKQAGVMQDVEGAMFSTRATMLVVNVTIVVVAVLVGAVLGPVTGLSSQGPGGIGHTVLDHAGVDHVLAGVLGGLAAAAVVLPGYYGWLRPRLPAEHVENMERVRLGMGLAARVLQGGVVEEVVFRWGAMSALAAVGVAVTGDVSPTVIWCANAGAALLFGWAHIHGASLLGIPRTRAVVGGALFLNGWLGLVCGWLFWRYGLPASMVAHALVHLAWAPIDSWHHEPLVAS